MDCRALTPIIRMLVISQLLVALSLAPADLDTETPSGTEPPATETLDARPAAISAVTPDPHSFASIDFTRPRLHLYVPQPE